MLTSSPAYFWLLDFLKKLRYLQLIYCHLCCLVTIYCNFMFLVFCLKRHISYSRYKLYILSNPGKRQTNLDYPSMHLKILKKKAHKTFKLSNDADLTSRVLPSSLRSMYKLEALQYVKCSLHTNEPWC